MRKNGFLLFCFFLSFHIYCQESKIKKSPVNGTWIEEVSKTDTIVFHPEYDGRNPIFYLYRGRNTDNLPKIFSGPYRFMLSNDSISINWFLSSNIAYNTYYFKISKDGNELKIGNFFSYPYIDNVTLTFIRQQEKIDP